MVTNEEVKRNNERLESLRKLTLEKYLDEVEDLNNDMLLYDVMFHHLTNGDFASDYEFSVLKGSSKEEKKDIMKLMNNYGNLCFYAGSADNWSDSIETIRNADYELISARLLDNYEFLMSLAKYGDEEALEELSKLKNVEGCDESSVVEFLRNTFCNDEVLFKTVLNMSSKNSLFKVFTDEQKATLLKYPEGALYFYDNSSIKTISPLFLAMEICNRMGEKVSIQDREDIERVCLDVTSKLREISNDDFDAIVMDMSDDYVTENVSDLLYRGSSSSLPVMNDDGSFSKEIWINEENGKGRTM